MKDLVDVHYPDVDRIRLVMDNLNTHTLTSLYKVSDPSEVRRIVRKFEIDYTPKYGSWLNMAEIELSVLANQCLVQRGGRHAGVEPRQIREFAIVESQR